MRADKAIQVENLRKTYRGDIRALDGLSFWVDEGTIFGLVGPNGAGKSTAIKILTTLSKADSGNAVVGNRNVKTEADKVRRIIGCVPQQSGIFRDGTARENLALQGALYGLRGNPLKARIGQLLCAFGLSDAADRAAVTYSGGMLRRLDIAVGMIHRPQILFLDEPTTGLDPEARSSLWEIIRRLVKEEHVTILLTTHYLEEVDRLADRMAIVASGRTVIEGSPTMLKDALNEDTIAISVNKQMKLQDETISMTLRDIPGVLEVTVMDSAIRLRANNASSTLVTVLKVLSDCRVPVTSASIEPPTIEDVYMKYAGRQTTATA